MDLKRTRIVFLIPENVADESACSNDMHRAFEICKLNLINVEWAREDEFQTVNLEKTDVLVLQSFESKFFDSVKACKSTRIVGPWCVLTCLVDGRSIPNLEWPIFNVAMSDCVITCSNLSKSAKQEIQHKVQLMGGIYTDLLLTKNTHLITNSVRSEKYIKAVEAGLKVMLSSWVEDVWEASLRENVHSTNKQFDKHRCSPFHNLVVCSTGFTGSDERNALIEQIKENGGTYSGQLHIGKADVLVCKEGVCSAKLKAARKAKYIHCVTIDWVTDSIKKGYALPDDQYSVQRGTSTPTKTHDEALNPNFSVVSAISSVSILTLEKSVFEETVNLSDTSAQTMRKRKSSSMEELSEILDKIDIKRAKLAGTFLDGCNVYLLGFITEQREKLCKILNFSGATRYDDLSERVTHIIVGDASCHELKLLRSKGVHALLLGVRWLLDSIEQKQPVPEENYFITESESPRNESGSPLSAKGLQLLRAPNTSTTEKTRVPDDDSYVEGDGDNALIQQYLKPGFSGQEDTLANINLSVGESVRNPVNVNATKPDVRLYLEPESTDQEDTLAQYLKTNYDETDKENNTYSKRSTARLDNENEIDKDASSKLTQNTADQSFLFESLKFLVVNFSEDEHKNLKELVESGHGQVVSKSYRGVPDYCIVPVFNTEPVQTASEIVTEYWLMESVTEGELQKVLYYHKSYSIHPTDILKGCVVTISSYTQYERAFLNNLIEHLGAVSQEQLCRVAKGKMLATTHLLSHMSSSKKYNAAVKWNIPVVNKDWLLECARTNTFVSEVKYLTDDGSVQSISKSDDTIGTRQRDFQNTACEIAETTITTRVLDKSGDDTTLQNIGNVQTDERNNTDSVARNQTTPVRSKADFDIGKEVGTPVTRATKDFNSPEVNSQVTPINKILQEARMCHGFGNTPVTPRLKGDLDDIDTPDTPYGAFIRPNPSPHLRKVMVKWFNSVPDHRPKRDSTPLSEIKRQFWKRICSQETHDENKVPPPDFTSISSDEGKEETPPRPASSNTQEHAIVNDKLQQLQDMLTASGGNRMSVKKRPSTIPAEAAVTAMKDSQTCTVGWDYMDCTNEVEQQKCDESGEKHRMFMISGMDATEREGMVVQLQNLGAVVSDLANYDPASTHLVSAKPARNEKLMSSMAAGKWILHPSYVEQSVAAGRLLDEEDFEYGNPKCSWNIERPLDRETEVRVNAVHWWRKEIGRRGYGAFHDMRAIIIAAKRESLVRVIEAGGGMVVDVKPPFDGSVYATHCLLDPKAAPSDLSVFVPLAKQGVYVVHIFYINNFLHRNVKDIKDCVLPYFSKYYDQE